MSDTPTPSEPPQSAHPTSAAPPHEAPPSAHPVTPAPPHEPPMPRRSMFSRIMGGLLVYGLGIGVVAAGVLGARELARTRSEGAHAEGTAREHEVAAGPRVMVTHAGRSQADRTLTLLGEARPYATTTLYAKISGYLREIRVDRGDRVTAGQVLAVIDSPETEHQLQSARIDAANRHIAAGRARRLAAPGLVTEQDAENLEATARIADASVGAITSQRGFRLVHAPFAGVVTARFADVGALVQSATGSQSGALPVVRVSNVDRLRVFIYLTQHDAELVRVGDSVRVASADRPDQLVEARVSRTSHELDARTRTLLTEVDLDNHDGRFVAGSYLNVSLHVTQPTYPEVPTEALVLRGAQTFVALVSADDRVHFQAVQVLDDDGSRARIVAGLHEGDRVAVGLGDTVEEGVRVQPVAAPPPPGGPRPPGGANAPPGASGPQGAPPNGNHGAAATPGGTPAGAPHDAPATAPTTPSTPSAPSAPGAATAPHNTAPGTR